MYLLLGRLTFGCEDCRYFQTLYTYERMVHGYWESEYGLCTNENVCHPVRAEDDICRHFDETDYFTSELYIDDLTNRKI